MEVEEVEGAGSEQDEDEDGNEDAMEDRGYHDSCSSMMRDAEKTVHLPQQRHIPQRSKSLKNTKKKMSVRTKHQPLTTRTYALQTRIQVVKISVEVVVQRLMEAVQGGWVVELWRGVGVVVDLVERGGGEEGEEEEWL
jgi:hypothetical protein